MAITSDALQTELGVGIGDPLVVIAYEPSVSTEQQWYINGRQTLNVSRFCNTTASDDAATQAADILAQLAA